MQFASRATAIVELKDGRSSIGEPESRDSPLSLFLQGMAHVAPSMLRKCVALEVTEGHVPYIST